MDSRQTQPPQATQECLSPLPCSSHGLLPRVSLERTPTPCDSKRGSGCTPPLRKPKHPLNAYNLFFRAERARLLGIEEEAVKTSRRQRAHKRTHGKISFSDLGKMIGKKWKELDSVTRATYQAEAESNSKRYKDEMAVYKQAMATAQAKAEREESCRLLVVTPEPAPRPAQLPVTREQHHNVLQLALDLVDGACAPTTCNKSLLIPNLDPIDLSDGSINAIGDDIIDDEAIKFLQGLVPMEEGGGNPVTSSFHGSDQNIGLANHVPSADVTGAGHIGSWDDPFPFTGIAPSWENLQPRFFFEHEDYYFGMENQARKRAKLSS